MYDIVIIGAGPAGSSLARELPRNLKTAIIDKRTLKGDRPEFHRSCGGLLSPDAQIQLAGMNLALPASVLVNPQIFSVHSSDLATGRSQFYPRHYLNMDRLKFEKWLRSMIPAHIQRSFGWQVYHIQKEEGYFSLRLRNGWEDRTIRTRYLVGADGPGSIVRKTFFPEGQTCSRYVSIQETFALSRPKQEFGVYFHQELTDYYGWTIPKGTDLLFGAAFPLSHDNPWTQYQKMRAKLQDLNILPKTGRKKEGSFILRPSRAQHILSGQKRLALIGEAGGWISPSSAEGYSFAFQTARFLAEAFFEKSQAPMRAYDQKTKGLRRGAAG
jgi:geranylgeranyl reductase